MMKHFLLLSLVALLFSCSNSEHDKTDALIAALDSLAQMEETTEESDLLPAYTPVFAKNGLDFAFGGFIVSIDSVFFDYDSDNIIPLKNDTCYYDLELGEEVENTLLRISPTTIKEFVAFDVYQRDLFHFTIGDEGPHCDMVETEPYHSEWIQLKTKKPNYSFHTLKWGQVKEPEVNMSDEAFEAFVLEHCGERWVNALHADYISNAAQDHLATSTHQFKIVATLSDGTVETYYIELSSPMGC